MSAREAIGEFRRELAQLVKERGKDAVRTFLNKAVVRLDLDKKDEIVRCSLTVTACYLLASPVGLEYVRVRALKDLETLP